MQKFTKIPLLLSAIFICNAVAAQKDSTRSLDEVIVTGQYKPQTLKSSVYQVRVINNRRIYLSGATSLQQVLNTQLGFRFSNDNTLGISDAKLNGMGGTNVKILLDGVPMVDRYDQRVSLSQIDINTVDHIEIVEGPMSVSYGSDAMAGVINIITKKNPDNNLSVNAKAQEETVDNDYYPFSYRGVHNQTVNVNYRKDHFIAAIGGTHNDFDGYGMGVYGRFPTLPADGVDLTWKPKEQWMGNVKFGYVSSRFNIYYRLDALDETIKVRNAINFNIYKAIDQKYISDRYIHQIQSDYKFNNNLQWTGFLAYTDYKRHTKTTEHDFQTGTDALTAGAGEQDISKLNSFAFKNTLQYKISSKLSLQPGLDINHEKASGARIDGSPQINDYALFVSAEYKPTTKINLRPGLRFTKNSQYDAPVAIPSINTKYTLSKNLDLRLSYGYGFRAPTLRELYLTFFDANHNLVGNPNLKAEYSNSVNGSLNWTPAIPNGIVLTSTLAGFFNAYRNQIDLLVSAPGSSIYTYFNIDRSKTAGGSIDNQLTWKKLDVSLGFSYTGFSSSLYDDKAYVKQDNRDFLWTPEVNSNIYYNFSKLKTKIGVFYKYTGKKPAFSFGTTGTQQAILLTQTSGYSLADLNITTAINKLISVNAGIKNIFDVREVNSNTVISSASAHSSTGPQSIGYGRSFILGLAFQWNKK